jgi:Niemann-Pick C1 protein
MTSCVESVGNKIESAIGSFFSAVGLKIATIPRKTILFSILLCGICGAGFARWSTENRPDKLWVPQQTLAEAEGNMFTNYYARTSRFNDIIVRSSTDNGNILSKSSLIDVMSMHLEIENNESEYEDTTAGTKTTYTFVDLCTTIYGGNSCADGPSTGNPVCNCLVNSILKLWNYDLQTLENDSDVLATINSSSLYEKEDLQAALGKPIFDSTTGDLLSAEAFRLSYLTKDRSGIVADGGDENTDADPINEAWEEAVFLKVLQESVPEKYTSLSVDYFAGRSFSDEFGNAITGDLLLVQISYVIVFLFLGATLGNIIPGPGSRWTMSLAALVTVGLSLGAGFGISSAIGLFYGPVHSLLPFILLGIGVDDAFVIVNAFNRERKVSRSSESNEDLIQRSGKALARAGASITVTSLTDLVAFGISASSSLPALASFCGYAAIGIFFLWLFASTFFTATLVLDERRQRDNRRECLCCVTRKKEIEEEEEGFQEGRLALYFRNYHAPAILSKVGKVIVIIVYACLLGFGIWGALNLSVEDTERSFVPNDSYLTGYLNTADEYYPSTGIDLYIVFEGGSDIYARREEFAALDTRLSGKSSAPPYIAEPTSDEKFRNVMEGLASNLSNNGSISGVELGDDNWPKNETDFITELISYTSSRVGAGYTSDVSFVDESKTAIEAIRVQSEYIRLTKTEGSKVIDDADKQIAAMDATREMIESWDDLPTAFPYSEKFIAIEGFKIIRKELFLNVGLALLAVGVIVLLTVPSPITAIVITVNVAFCIVEILGFMHALGIAIDSVSVINIVLAVGLSIDYSAHVGHCFMTKGGDDKNKRALEALADIGSAVLSGALTTFLAVVVLLFSSSYVFATLSIQFALTVGLGVTHGLILLPVLLSLIGPKSFTSAEELKAEVESPSNSAEFTDDPKKNEDDL